MNKERGGRALFEKRGHTSLKDVWTKQRFLQRPLNNPGGKFGGKKTKRMWSEHLIKNKDCKHVKEHAAYYRKKKKKKK